MAWLVSLLLTRVLSIVGLMFDIFQATATGYVTAFQMICDSQERMMKDRVSADPNLCADWRCLLHRRFASQCRAPENCLGTRDDVVRILCLQH